MMLSAVVLGHLRSKIGSRLPINKTRNLLSANFTEHTVVDATSVRAQESLNSETRAQSLHEDEPFGL